MMTLWGLLLPSVAQADVRQYRQLTLVDGRVLVAEILSTEAQGLALNMPQGKMLVSFELLQDMIPIDEAAYQAQSDWTVWLLLPDVYQAQGEELLDAIEGIDAAKAGYGASTVAMSSQIVDCGEDIDCIANASASSAWKWIVVGTESPSGELVLRSRTNRSTVSAHKVELTNTGREDFWTGFHDLLGLDPPSGPAPKGSGGRTTSTRPTSTTDEGKVIAMSFVPVPGLPSLVQQDTAGFATALGIVVPTTAIWVGAVGQTGQNAAEFSAISFAGFYAATVITNQVTGLRSLDKKGKPTVTVAPTEAGSQVVVGGSF